MKQLGWGSFVKEDDLPVLLERWQTAIDTGSNYEVTVPLRSASGEYRTFYVSAAPLKDLDGNIVQWFGTNTDVTDLYRAQEELKSASRHKDEFLAMLAHELRNPLAPISAAATLMQMIQLNADQLKDTSNIISRQVRHMTGLIDDLMDVSRVTRGLIILNKMELDAKRIIYDAVEQVEPMMRAKRHHLNLELAPSSAHVFGDQKRLVQCLTNLLNNAAKYTPEGGEIHLRMDVKNEEVSLSIHDNGIGIAPDLQSRIFELFTQAERTADRSQGGLGIGLALVKSLVELHGGTVVCKSAGLGKGSQFTISLPRLLTQVELADGKFHSLATAQNAIKKLRILVVDDNVDAAKMLSFFLQAAGHEVMVEHGAKQALERARAEKPDVCILDIGLPEMDGNELARTLRQDTETANVFLVAVTGYGQEQDKKNALAAGFHQHLVKPVDTAKLLDLTNEICRR
jgi:signal transduction histidine kinase/CheY-like chemotaxis protein